MILGERHNTKAPLHPSEDERLQSLQSTKLLDSEPSIRFDAITELASKVFNVPIALVSLVDANRQWFLSNCGLSVNETHRDEAFCAHALHEEDLLVVEDASLHPIFKHNSLVTGEPFIRFYAGAVIRDGNNLPLGTLCILDHNPRIFNEQERQSLLSMVKLVQHEVIQPEELTMQRMRCKLQTNHCHLTNALWGDTFFDETNRRISNPSGQGQFYMLCIEYANIDTIENHYGAVVADEIILEMTARLRVCVSKIGRYLLGRMNNKEFGVIIGLDHGVMDSALQIEAVTHRLNHCLAGSVSTSVAEIEACINVTVIQDDFAESSPQEIFRMAQICVKDLPKKAGINIDIVTEKIRHETIVRSELTREFGKNVDENSLHMIYQPKVDPLTEALVGLEALVRWEHPIHGFVSPLTIIKLAKESNNTFKLEKWIFTEVLSQTKYWKEQGFDVPRVSINVTGETLLQYGFVDFVAEQLQQHNLNGENFDIEIVESSMFEDFEAVINIMNQLRELGISFSLDDFGTGFSNLAYLKALPITYLKIDKSFIDDITLDPDSSAMCAGIISLAHDLGMKTVAEGVESESQTIALKALRCNVIQGYFYSKPISAKEIEMKYYSAKRSCNKVDDSKQINMGKRQVKVINNALIESFKSMA